MKAQKKNVLLRNWWKVPVDKDPDYERKRQKELENFCYYLIRIDPDKKDFNDYEEFGRASAYITESIKKQTGKSTKNSLINDLSKRLLGLEFKSNHSLKSKCLKWIVKKMLPKYKKGVIKNMWRKKLVIA